MQNISVLTTGSTVAVQREDGGVWMHISGLGHGTEDHRGTTYKIRVTEARCTVNGTKRHWRSTPCQGKNTSGMKCQNKQNTGDRINELTDHFAELHNHEHLNEMETEGKDRVPRTLQPLKHMNAEHTETIRQSSNKTKGKWERTHKKHA